MGMLEKIEYLMQIKNISNKRILADVSGLPSLVSIAGERSKIRSKLEKLKDLYLDNLIDKNTYRRDYEDLTAKLNKLDKIDRPEPKRINVSALKSFLAKDIKTIYHSMSREERQMLWHGIIKEIRFDAETLEPRVTYL